MAKSSGVSGDINAQTAAWQLITTGIGYAMITLNLLNLEKNMINEMISAILQGLKA